MGIEVTWYHQGMEEALSPHPAAYDLRDGKVFTHGARLAVGTYVARSDHLQRDIDFDGHLRLTMPRRWVEGRARWSCLSTSTPTIFRPSMGFVRENRKRGR